MARSSRKAQILEHLRETGAERIGESAFAELLVRFAPVSEAYLRNVLRRSGRPLAPLVEGVRQESLESLERTLLAILDEYEGNSGTRAQRACRRTVIRAKDHAKLSLRKASAEKRVLKEEMILRMLTWLENPGLFREWLELRKRGQARLIPSQVISRLA